MLYLQISFSAHLALLVVEVNKELGIVLKSTSLCQVFIQSKNINIANLENFFFIFKWRILFAMRKLQNTKNSKAIKMVLQGSI